MKNLLLVSLIFIAACAGMVGGAQTPEDLMEKEVFGKYKISHGMTETFECLERWVRTKMPMALRREISSDGKTGHLFWKDNWNWVNFTLYFRTNDNGLPNELSIYRSANIPAPKYLRDAAYNCAVDVKSYPDSNF